MIQEELLRDIIQRLERMEQGQQTLQEDLSAFRQDVGEFTQETATSLRDLQRSVHGLKIKARKTWNLLYYFTKDADARIVKTARRVDAIEDHLGLAHKN